jgi:hypothetical protein
VNLKKKLRQEVRSSSGEISIVYLGIVLLIVVLALWGGTIWIMLCAFSNWQDRGQSGDMFGAVNALFTGLAFAGVIVTLHMQMRQLEEMRRARELQVQPFLAASLEPFLLLEKPAIRMNAAGGRFSLRFKLKNVSREPAIDVYVRSTLTTPSNNFEVKPTSIALPLLPDEESGQEFTFFITYEGILECADGICDNQKFDSSMETHVTIVFQNTLGGYFRIDQSFAYKVCAEDLSEFQTWIGEMRSDATASPNGVSGATSVRLVGVTRPGMFSYKSVRKDEIEGFGSDS